MLDLIFPLSAQAFVGIIVCVVVIHVILGTIPQLIWLERKLSAYIQDRIGPNRAGLDFGLPALKYLFRGWGFWGLGQALADGVKMFLKEDVQPRGADKALFTLAPMAAVVPAFIGWAIIPWGGYIEVPAIAIGSLELVAPGRALVGVADINVGFVYLLAVASLGIYGVTLGGWASNNKYSFLGGLRASAGMISYEIPLGLALLATLLLAGSFQPSSIIQSQIDGVWFIVAQPLAAILFYVCILAEANRAPFDNAEAEQELIGGYHTEYSAMRFGLFFLAEYAHMITSSAFFVLIFLGGYHLPGVALTSPEATGILAVIVKFLVFFNKALLSVAFMMLIRWTLPRIRYDQVLRLCWQSLIPLGIVLVVATSVMMYLGLTHPIAMLAMNGAIAAVVLVLAPMTVRTGETNKKIALAGSRFSPLPGAATDAAPRDPVALDDDDPFLAARRSATPTG